jgi:hypothetical protein
MKHDALEKIAEYIGLLYIWICLVTFGLIRVVMPHKVHAVQENHMVLRCG